MSGEEAPERVEEEEQRSEESKPAQQPQLQMPPLPFAAMRQNRVNLLAELAASKIASQTGVDREVVKSILSEVFSEGDRMLQKIYSMQLYDWLEQTSPYEPIKAMAALKKAEEAGTLFDTDEDKWEKLMKLYERKMMIELIRAVESESNNTKRGDSDLEAAIEKLTEAVREEVKAMKEAVDKEISELRKQLESLEEEKRRVQELNPIISRIEQLEQSLNDRFKSMESRLAALEEEKEKKKWESLVENITSRLNERISAIESEVKALKAMPIGSGEQLSSAKIQEYIKSIGEELQGLSKALEAAKGILSKSEGPSSDELVKKIESLEGEIKKLANRTTVGEAIRDVLSNTDKLREIIRSARGIFEELSKLIPQPQPQHYAVQHQPEEKLPEAPKLLRRAAEGEGGGEGAEGGS